MRRQAWDALGRAGYGPVMCRSIKTLRPPFTEDPTSADIHAAALQYVRKVAGMRKPSKINEEAFTSAVSEIAAATERLLGAVAVRHP